MAVRTVGVLLTGRFQGATCELIAGQLLVSDDPGACDNHWRETRKPTHADLVGSRTGGGTDQIVVRKLDMREIAHPSHLDAQIRR